MRFRGVCAPPGPSPSPPPPPRAPITAGPPPAPPAAGSATCRRPEVLLVRSRPALAQSCADSPLSGEAEAGRGAASRLGSRGDARARGPGAGRPPLPECCVWPIAQRRCTERQGGEGRSCCESLVQHDWGPEVSTPGQRVPAPFRWGESGRGCVAHRQPREPPHWSCAPGSAPAPASPPPRGHPRDSVTPPTLRTKARLLLGLRGLSSLFLSCSFLPVQTCQIISGLQAFAHAVPSAQNTVPVPAVYVAS